MLSDLLGNMLGGFLGRRGGDRRRRRRQDAHARSGRFPAQIRLSEGSEPGLFPWWQAGQATVSPGAVRFRPRRSSVVIAVEVLSHRLRAEAPADAPTPEVDEQLNAIELDCAAATVELIVPARYAAEVAHRLRPTT